MQLAKKEGFKVALLDNQPYIDPYSEAVLMAIPMCNSVDDAIKLADMYGVTDRLAFVEHVFNAKDYIRQNFADSA